MVQAADGNDDDGARQGSDCSLSQDAVSLAAKSLRLYVRNQHGAACPMPFLQSVKFSFTDIKEFEAHVTVHPFQAAFILNAAPTNELQVQVELDFNPDLNGPARKTIQYIAHLGRRKAFEKRVECKTQHLAY
ncbi:hypothetical protein H632_c971p1 [Helicosporidium sp. ATCC 50920]|nr:hypothetical protein H632_c971p1 [Helicosporidium sp. ATCC 50920]|eukprot:KDD74947.1 hypothetical protein H632_c971p1 [Helicosporidium sp. ATCC 50920]